VPLSILHADGQRRQLYGGSELDKRGSNTVVFEIFGHLKPGVTLTQATADVNA